MQVRIESFDELRHDLVRNHHAFGDAMRSTNRLQKVHDELTWPSHHDGPGAETAISDIVGHSGAERRVALVWVWTIFR
jgi:hypothetical protein